VLWKELRNLTVFGSRRPFVIYAVPALIVCLLVAAGIGVAVFVFGNEASQVMRVMTGCTLGIHLGAILGFSMTAAKGIASEREARTLPVLLTAPLENEEIIRDKARGAFWQGLLVLAPMSLASFLLLILLAEVTKGIGPLDVAGGTGLYLVSLLGIVPFFIGLGLYCSVRLKTTTAAATGCMSLVFLGLMALGIIGTNLARPLRMNVSQMWLTAFVLVILAALACAGIGRGFLRAAARRLRRNVF
jgi:ABC-type Na+ efflux pump permease subunit